MSTTHTSANPLEHPRRLRAACLVPTREALLTPSTRRGWLLAALLLVLWGHLGIVHPARHWLVDFRAYYAAGRALHAGIGAYETARIRTELGPTLPGAGQSVLRYAYPPPTLPLVYAIAVLPLEAAQIAWCTVQYAALVGAVFLVLRAVAIPLSSRLGSLIVIGFLLSSPVTLLFRWGQWDGLVVLLVAGAFAAMMQPTTMRAGLWLGAAALAKIFPLVYLWVLVVRREGRALLAAVTLIGAMMGGSWLLLSDASRAGFIENATFKRSGHHYYVPRANMSLFGLVHRALVDDPDGIEPNTGWLDLGPRAAFAASVTLSLFLIVITTLWMWRNQARLSGAESLAAMIPVLLLITPVAWPHHTVQALIPLALIIATVVRQPAASRGDAAWVWVMVVLYLFNPFLRTGHTAGPAMAHLVTPLTTYAVILAWLFMLFRYLPLRDAAGHGERIPAHEQL